MTPLEWLAHTGYATMIRDSAWGYPLSEIAHLLGITLLVGSIVLTDLRLLGLSRRLPVTLTAKHLLTWTWIGFGMTLLAGASLFSAFPNELIQNSAFRIKMLLLICAALNAAFFHFRIYSNVAAWNLNKPTPIPAKIAGLVSILLWTLIVVAGRWIAYAT